MPIENSIHARLQQARVSGGIAIMFILMAAAGTTALSLHDLELQSLFDGVLFLLSFVVLIIGIDRPLALRLKLTLLLSALAAGIFILSVFNIFVLDFEIQRLWHEISTLSSDFVAVKAERARESLLMTESFILHALTFLFAWTAVAISL
ncbi:MAG: hypothetical protein HY286_12460 [Planctomycetes bacterium]|nr:hypothetical protein [Planctomycetota bacterium]